MSVSLNNPPSINELNGYLVNIGVVKVVRHCIGDSFNINDDYIAISGSKGETEEQSIIVKTSGHDIGSWYDASPAAKISSGNLVDFWCISHEIDLKAAYKDICAYLKLPSITDRVSKPKLRAVPNTGVTSDKNYVNKIYNSRKASDESIRKSTSRLKKNITAKESLYEQGFSDETIEYFNLGLSDSYTGTDNVTRSDALMFPIRSASGVLTTPNAYYSLDNITINPIANSWCKNPIRCNYNTARLKEHTLLLICESHKDMWAIHQSINGTELVNKLLIITSTKSTIVPEEITLNPKYFEGFTKVFMAQGASEHGEINAKLWSEYAGPKSYRVRPLSDKHPQKSWVDYFNHDGSFEEFVKLLSDADPLSFDTVKQTPDSVFDYLPNKVYNYSPIDISGAFHNEYLYFPIVAHETSIHPETKEILHNKTTIVIRSDQQMLRYRELPCSSKSTVGIFALSDGTIIDGPPRIPSHPSWSFDEANSWVSGISKPRSIDSLLKDIVEILRSRVWLPNSEDYAVLALTSVITYLQEAFDAVPLILMEGQAGTGKTDTTEVMSSISCNGVTVSESSAATITRTIESARGFIALDDIEKIAKNLSSKNTTAASDDIIQVLKTSYKKVSSKRNVTDPKTMAVQVLNFYGVKMMSNTSGIDDILGTRTLIIHTRKAPIGKFKSKDFDPIRARKLRYELHAWAMENINKVHESYKKLDRDDRLSEICAPLRSIANQARKSTSQRFNAALDKMIERRGSEDNSKRSPSDVAFESVMRLIGLGFKTVCLEQIVMEMSLMVPLDYQKEYSTDIPEWRNHQWLRRTLQQMGLISSSGIKFRPFGSTTSRLYHFTQDAFDSYTDFATEMNKESIQKLSIDGDGSKFCKSNLRCKSCRYDGVDCDIRKKGKRI